MLYKVMQATTSSLLLLLNLNVYANTIELGEIIVHKKQMGIEHPIEPAIGISKEDRLESIRLLNEILADEAVIFFKTYGFHWNVEGPEFNDYHNLFEEMYRQLFEFKDGVAERARMVGGIALGSLAECLKTTRLKEETGDVPAPREMVRLLLNDHESLIRNLQIAIEKTAGKDAGTNNFLTDLLEKHDKIAWKLRSLLAERKRVD